MMKVLQIDEKILVWVNLRQFFNIFHKFKVYIFIKIFSQPKKKSPYYILRFKAISFLVKPHSYPAP